MASKSVLVEPAPTPSRRRPRHTSDAVRIRCASSTGRRSGTWRMQVPRVRRSVTEAATDTAISGSGKMEPRPIASKHHRLSKPVRSTSRAPAISASPVSGLPSAEERGIVTPSRIVVDPPLQVVRQRLGWVGELSGLRMGDAETHEALSNLDRHGDGIEHGDAGQTRQLDVVAAEAGAGEDDDLGAVLGDDRADLLGQLAQGLVAVGHALFDIDVDRAHRGALGLEAVIADEVL